MGQGGAWLVRQRHSFKVLFSDVWMAVLGPTFSTFCMRFRSKVHGNSNLSLPVKLRLVGNIPFTLSVMGICFFSFLDFHFSTFFHVFLSCSVFQKFSSFHITSKILLQPPPSDPREDIPYSTPTTLPYEISSHFLWLLTLTSKIYLCSFKFHQEHKRTLET